MSEGRASKWAELVPKLSYLAVVIAFGGIVLAGLLPSSEGAAGPESEEVVVAQAGAGAEEGTSERLEAIRQRANLRAYEGAPPVIPHEIDDVTVAPACLDCHGVFAPAASHELHPTCTQCHAPVTQGRSDAPPLAENDFAGAVGPAEGEVAFPGAPPLIPHPTLMRASCLSCHGELGMDGLRTPHPDRVSCTQCHAPSAELDQH